MDTYKQYLKTHGDIGRVEAVNGSIITASGLPNALVRELVMFENGNLGMVFSLLENSVQILTFFQETIEIGSGIARTNAKAGLQGTQGLLGSTISPVPQIVQDDSQRYEYEAVPQGIQSRVNIEEQFHTGVMMVDIILTLGKGQRELVIGDRKTGKTVFVQHALVSHAKAGGVCIYCAIGKQSVEVKRIEKYFKDAGIHEKVLIILTQAADTPGTKFIAPYVAMSAAEYFRDQGNDVLVVLDDLTAHAAVYREISLSAGRFPGRNAYPSDIFYAHSSLLERAGNFEKGSITCLPVADTALGDISGYIHTNLMAITDGHLFFDQELFNAGQRPAVNPFLSVTRVGRQTQSSLAQEISSRLTRFLVQVREIQELAHFGSGLSESNQKIISMGKKLYELLDQTEGYIVHVNLSYVLFAGIWGNVWADKTLEELKTLKAKAIQRYMAEPSYKTEIDAMVSQSKNLNELIVKLVQSTKLFQ